MAKRPIKVYADTSVYGGVFDEEFADAKGLSPNSHTLATGGDQL